MTVSTAVVALALAAWLLSNLALLWALTGTALGDEVPGNRILTALVLLAGGALGNSFALDQLGRYFGL